MEYSQQSAVSVQDLQDSLLTNSWGSWFQLYDKLHLDLRPLKKMYLIRLLFFLHPFRTPRRWLKWIGPELCLINDLPIAHSRERNRSTCNRAIGHTDIGDNLIAFRDDPMYREFPASMRGVMLIDGDKVCASPYLLTGLGPLENVVIMQEFSSRLKVIRLHGGPELLNYLFVI
jgi:hypothetical protein